MKLPPSLYLLGYMIAPIAAILVLLLLLSSILYSITIIFNDNTFDFIPNNGDPTVVFILVMLMVLGAYTGRGLYKKTFFALCGKCRGKKELTQQNPIHLTCLDCGHITKKRSRIQ